MVLAGDEARSPAGAGHEFGLGDLPAGAVGVADVADLAAGDELVEGVEGLLDRGQRVRGVELVEVDPVRAEPAQRGLRGLDDVAAGTAGAEVVAVGAAHVHAELGADHGVVAAAPEGLAQHRLAEARFLAVGVGDVEEGNAGVQGGMHDGVGPLLRLGGRIGPAQVVAAKPDDGDGQSGISYAAVFSHGVQPITARSGSRAGQAGRAGGWGWPAGPPDAGGLMAVTLRAVPARVRPGHPRVGRGSAGRCRASRQAGAGRAARGVRGFPPPRARATLRAGAASPAGSGVLPG